MKNYPFLFLIYFLPLSVFSQINLSLSASKTSFLENDSVDITATLDAVSNQDVTLDFELGGTAMSDADYTTAFLSKGSVTTVAGGNGSGSASNQLAYPQNVAIDSDGNVFILGGDYIKKWVPGADTGIIVARTNIIGKYFFMDSKGDFYLSDDSNNQIIKWTNGGSDWLVVAGGNGAGSNANQLNRPRGIFVDSEGNIYIADKDNYRIQKWAPGATEGVTVAGGNDYGTNSNQLSSPIDVSVDSQGNLYILDLGYIIKKWMKDASEGNQLFRMDNAANHFYRDKLGNLFLSEYQNARVVKWIPTTNDLIPVAGGNGDGSDANQLNHPSGLSLDKDGNLYIADYDNHRIQKVQYAAQIVIPAGETEGQIKIKGMDDSSDENDESIVLTPVKITNANLATTDPLNLTILDNDEIPQVSFSFSADKIQENSSTDVSLIATTSEISGKDIAISFSMEGDAVETEEYVVSAKNMTIVAGDSTASIRISTNGLDDAIVEPLKTIVFRVNSISNATAMSETAQLNYESDDDPGFSLTASKTTIAEHESTTITASLESPTSKDVLLDFELGGTATPDVDFTSAFLTRGSATTIAGGNGSGQDGDQLANPNDVAIDSDGNVYTLDSYSIKKWVPGVDTGVEVVSPSSYYDDLVVDSLGNIYVLDNYYNRVQKWAVGATDWITVAGGNGSGSAANQLNGPTGLFVDTDGAIYIADTYNHRVQKWAAGATQGETVAGGNGAGSAANQLYQPRDVSVDGDGNIYVLDSQNHRIQKWEEGVTEGSTLTLFNSWENFRNFFVDVYGHIFLVSVDDRSVSKWNSTTDQWTTVAGGNGLGSDANQLNNPGGITFDKYGNLYVADSDNHRIQKVQYAPQILIPAGQTEGSFTLSGIDDDLYNEGEESILVKAKSAENAVLGSPEDISITLLDNTKTLSLQETPFMGLSNGAVSWGDYDRDGDMDVAVMGLSPTTGAVTAVYENQNGTFVNANQNLTRLYEGDIKWVDINKDGWVDLVVSGYNDQPRTLLYLNNQGVLEATDNYGLPQLYTSKMAWGDLDNDGDIDLAISGIDELDNFVFAIYYRDDDSDNFTQEKQMDSYDWPGFINGDLKIVDIDLDGDNDIVFSGENSLGSPVGDIHYNTYIDAGYHFPYYTYQLKNSCVEVAKLRNSPLDGLSTIFSGIDYQGQFKLTAVNMSVNTDIFPKLKDGDISFGDFDNDGLNDVVFTGENESGVPITKLFLQNQNGSFRASSIDLQGLRNSTAEWVDYDMDGDLDLFITGLDETGAKSLLYKSVTANKVNNPPAKVSGLQVEDLGYGKVRFSWDTPQDDFSSDLGYVLRLGTSPGGSELSNTESDLETGRRLISKYPPIYTNFFETQLDPGMYYWAVQAVDQGLKGGAFSEESSFVLTYDWKQLNQGGIVDKSIEAVKDPILKFVDVDNDNDMDLIYGSSGSTGYQSKLYKYNGKRLESNYGPFYESGISDIEVGDVNGDGIADILFNSQLYSGDYALRFYLGETGNYYQIDMGAGLYKAKGRIIDLNNDGQDEVVVIGLSNNLASGKIKLKVFEWNKDAVPPSFTEKDISDQIASLSSASFDLGDIDNDQDIDLLMNGFSVVNGLRCYVYKNITELGGSYQFELADNNFDASIDGSTNLIDFDGDGDLDVLISGTSFSGDVFDIYENQVNQGLNDWTKLDNTGLNPMRLGKVDLGDFNADGYSDLLYSGVVGGSGKVTKLDEFNPRDNTYSESPFDVSDIVDADVEFGDLEGDGDLDFAISGESSTETGKYIFKAFVNVRNESAQVLNVYSSLLNQQGSGFKNKFEDTFNFNSAPDIPVSNEASGVPGAVANAKGIPVSLSWNASADDHTPFGGITYAVKVGHAPGGEDVMSSNSNANGKRKTARKGNAEHNLKWNLRLPSGTYYWSVQAIDASYTGSEFTEPKMFQLSDALGVNDQNLSKDLSAYPNPTRGNFEVQIPGTANRAVLIISNPLGEKISEQNLLIEGNRKVKLDISALAEGIYFARIKTSDANYSFKIAKE